MDLQEFSKDMNNIKEIAEDFKSLKDIIQSMDIPELTSKIKSALDGVSESMSNINKETSNENTEAKEAESSEVSEGEEETNEDGHQASVLSKIINKLKGLGSISLETFSNSSLLYFSLKFSAPHPTNIDENKITIIPFEILFIFNFPF